MSIKRIFLNFSLDFQRQFVRVQLNQWLFWICYAARGAPLRLCIAELNQWSFLMCYAGCALNSAHVLQSVQLFCSVVLNSSGIDYHVVLAQNAFQQCLNSPELQPELLAILAKQTGRQATNRHGVQVHWYSMTIQADQHGRQAANWHWVQALICSIYRMMFTSTSRVYQNGFIFCSAKRFRRRHTNPDPWTVRISKCMNSLHLDSHCAVIA